MVLCSPPLFSSLTISILFPPFLSFSHRGLGDLAPPILHYLPEMCSEIKWNETVESKSRAQRGDGSKDTCQEFPASLLPFHSLS